MAKRIFAMVSTASSKVYTPFAIESFLANTALEPGETLTIIDNDGSLVGAIDTDILKFVIPPAPRSFAENFNSVIPVKKDEAADIYFLNNDIIFTDRWIEPLLEITNAIVTPVSNREFQYRRDGLRLERSFSIEEYLPNKHDLAPIVAYHQRKHSLPNSPKRRKVLSLPFFCVKVPFQIWSTVGQLDESFGKGGAEDNDYCLRAHEAGFSVEYALESYLLHFSGKSTWDGAETPDETKERDELYLTRFQGKWGEALTALSIKGDITSLYANQKAFSLFQQGQFGGVVEALMNPRGVSA